MIARSYIDKLVLGPHHMYHGTVGVNEPVSSATCVDTYHCGLHDPEGILGMLTASVITFCGVQAGRVIVSYKNVSPMAMIKRWLCWGLILCAIATLLCQASQNDGLYPINKNLWSPSFIALMAGLGEKACHAM